MSSPAPQTQQYLDEKAAAAYLGISPQGLVNLRRRGAGPAFIRLGVRLIRYSRVDLDAYMQARRVQAARN